MTSHLSNPVIRIAVNERDEDEKFHLQITFASGSESEKVVANASEFDNVVEAYGTPEVLYHGRSQIQLHG